MPLPTVTRTVPPPTLPPTDCYGWYNAPFGKILVRYTCYADGRSVVQVTARTRATAEDFAARYLGTRGFPIPAFRGPEVTYPLPPDCGVP